MRNLPRQSKTWFNRSICLAAAIAVSSTTDVTYAQNLQLLAPWVFTSTGLTTTGDVNICRNNAPAGNFWAGQPVITSKGDVDEHFRKHSVCITGATTKVKFNIGPAPTWVEFECTLNGSMNANMPGGAASVGGIGDINGKSVIGCSPRPVNVAGIGARIVATTDKIKICLQPGNHQALAELSITAAAPPGLFRNRHSIANFETAPVPNPGLPHGLMLILQPKGVCPIKQKGAGNFGDIDGDGYFTVTDTNMLATFLRDGPDKTNFNPRLSFGDVAKPCSGVPDKIDLQKLHSILKSRLEANVSQTVSSLCAESIFSLPAPKN